MIEQKLPQYRVWHVPTLTMHSDILGMGWQEDGAKTMFIVATKDEHIIEGVAEDFILMRKSTLVCVGGHPIYMGDVMRLSNDGAYPSGEFVNENFVVVEHDDGLWLRRGHSYIPLRHGVYPCGAHGIGNIFQDPGLLKSFEGIPPF